MGEFNDYVRRHPPYAEFNFVNLLSWDREGRGAVSYLHDNLVLFFPDYVDDVEFISVLGANEIGKTVRQLLRFADKYLINAQLRMVPETVARQLKASSVTVIEDGSNHDYVIDVSDLSAMQGPALRRFRRAVHTFQRAHGHDTSFTSLDICNTAIQRDVLRIFTARAKAKLDTDAAFELQALTRLLDHAKYFDLACFGVSVENILRAFIICERLADGWSIGHFWKGDTEFRGIYSYLMQHTAGAMLEEKITRMNIQQDLGISGLRFFKSSFAPVMNLKKFTIQSRAIAARQTTGSQPDA